MPELCANCKYFVQTGLNGPDSGECRFNAPSALDSNAFCATERRKCHFSVAQIMNTAGIAVGGRLPLYPAQFPPPPPTPQLLPTALTGVGLNSDTVCPFAIPRGFTLTGVAVNYSLANCGAGTPASQVDLDVVVCEVEGTTNTNEHKISIPIGSAFVGAQSNTTDNFHDTFFSTESISPYWTNSMVGAYIDLTTISDNKISEIRNAVIGLEYSWYTAPQRPFAVVRDKNTGWCGDYCPALDTSSNNRCWECHYFHSPDPETYSFGYCRRNAPSGIATASMPGFWTTADERLWEYTYAYLLNPKTTDWCGKYRKSTKPALPE